MSGWRADGGEELELVAAVVGGSESALAALYDRFADPIFALALRSTDDRQLAEEVVQETFLALWNRAELFDPTAGSLGTWLRSIARNRTIDRLRARGRRPTLVSAEADGPGQTSGSTLDDLARTGRLVGGATGGADPEQRSEWAEVMATVRGAVRALPDDERTVIVLAYQDELTQSEIADRLGWPIGTVKTRTRRALRRLREAMGEAIGPADALPVEDRS